jgi:hypothetical protein
VRCALDVAGSFVFSIPLRHAAARALVGVPFGSSPASAQEDGSPARYGILDWIAGTDGTSGVGVLADECAVVRVSSGELDVEMLAPSAPDGGRTTKFALAPFVDGWNKAGLAQRSQEISMPVELAVTDAHAGARDPRHSFVSLARVDKDGSLTQGPDAGVMSTSLRTAADGSWMLRLVETSDRAQDVLVVLDRPVFAAQRADLRGVSIGALHSERDRALIPIAPGRVENVILRSRP